MSKGTRLIQYPATILPCILVAVGILAFASPSFAAESAQFEVTIARASRSGSGIDARLNFAKADLQRRGYTSASYLRGSRIQLNKDQTQRFSVAEQISGQIQFKGAVGPKGERAQFYLALYSGSKKQFDANYSVWKNGAPVITIIDQPGGSAYIVIVRALS